MGLKNFNRVVGTSNADARLSLQQIINQSKFGNYRCLSFISDNQMKRKSLIHCISSAMKALTKPRIIE